MLHPTRTQATACGWALPSDSGSRFRREQDQGRGFGAARTAVSRASYRISRLEESLSCRPRASAREPVPRPDASLGGKASSQSCSSDGGAKPVAVVILLAHTVAVAHLPRAMRGLSINNKVTE